MRVYRVDFDLNHCQRFYLKDRQRMERFFNDRMLTYAGKSLRRGWKPLELFVLRPKLKKPDIWSFERPGCLITGGDALERMQLFYSMAGECLPVHYDGKELQLVNILECINCLNQEASNVVNYIIRDYVFYPDRFTESSLFKIPQTVHTEILCWEDEKDPESEFKAAVEYHGLKGLIFRELWRD